jgi:Tfp pilus assembly protein PilW
MIRRGRDKGWTIIEAMVALFLATIVLIVVGTVLRAGFRFSKMQSAATTQRTRMRVSLRHLERVLRGSSPKAVSWLQIADSASVLSSHPFRQGDFVSGPSWATHWECFVWDKSTRELRFLNTAGPIAAAPEDEPTAMTTEQLTTVAGLSSTSSRLLANRVTNFQYSQEPGPFFKIELEMELPRHENQREESPGRVRASRKFIPRN